MKVSIIGSGNVATHLAIALKKANVQVLNIWSHHLDNAQTLAKEVAAKAVASITDLVDSENDLIIISVKDDAVEEIANQLQHYPGLVAHTSGAVALQALSAIQNHGVFYPLQTFSKHKTLDFSKVPICIEANSDENLSYLSELASLLSDNVTQIDSEQRKTLHLAAVFACNFPNYLYSVAQELLAQQQLDFNLIRPLINETANKVQDALPSAVQTGPAIRHDEQTMSKHEALLKDSPQWLAIYHLLSENIKKTR